MNAAGMETTQGLSRTPPWYREPWPWILMAGPATVVLAGVLTGWLAVRSYDGLVADDYYKRGLAVNQVLARAREASRLGIEGSMRIAAGDTPVFDLDLASPSGTSPQTIIVALTHPTRVGLDQRIRAVLSERSYSGRMEPLAPGRWHVTVEDAQGQWRIGGTLHVPGTEEVQLRPAR